MARALAAIVAGLTIADPASAAVEIVAPFPLDRYAGTGAVGLAVQGAGPTVTRESALNTLLTGEVQSSLLGGTPASAPLPVSVPVDCSRSLRLAVTGGGDGTGNDHADWADLRLTP